MSRRRQQLCPTPPARLIIPSTLGGGAATPEKAGRICLTHTHTEAVLKYTTDHRLRTQL